MKILVTGSRGLLGRALCAHLQSEKHSVIGAHTQNCDLKTRESLSQFDHVALDQIFHLASWTQAGDFSLTHSGEQWIINQLINTHVLTWWQKKQPQAKLIAVGTSCGYDPAIPLKEENYLIGKPIDSLFTYAMTKRMLLSGLIALNRQFGLKYLYLIPPTLYGPGYAPKGKQLHFIFDLINKIIIGKKNNQSVVFWGDGEQRRELLYVHDFVLALCTLSKTLSNTLLNIGNGKDYRIKEYVKKVCALVGFSSKKIKYDTTKYVGAKAKLLNIDRLKQFHSHFSVTPLDRGLEQTVQYLLN